MMYSLRNMVRIVMSITEIYNRDSQYIAEIG